MPLMEGFDHLHIRPRFGFVLHITDQEALDRLKDKLQRDKRCTGQVVYSHVRVDVAPEDQHFWSPQLNFDIDPHRDNPDEAYMHGHIGPKPSVWTLFMFFYFLVGISGLFASLYGLSEWGLGAYSSWVWAFPIALVIISTAYFVGKTGEKLGHEQIDLLKNYVKEGLKKQ